MYIPNISKRIDIFIWNRSKRGVFWEKVAFQCRNGDLAEEVLMSAKDGCVPVLRQAEPLSGPSLC